MNHCKERWDSGWLRVVGSQRELTCCSASSSSLLIFRSSSNILHIDEKRDACYCSRDLPSACIRLNVERCDLPFPLKNLSGKHINYTAKAAPAHVGEWGSGQWMEHFAAKNLPDVQAFESSERKARLFFHLETFCLTSADLQPRIPWKQRGRARPRDRSLIQDCTWKFLGGFQLEK